MSKDKRTDWLLNLKVGDKVIKTHGRNNEEICTIINVTPTGRMTVVTSSEQEYQFDPRGSMIKEGKWNSCWLMEATTEAVTKLKHHRWRTHSDTILWSCSESRQIREAITDEDLKKLREILEPYYKADREKKYGKL